MTGLKFFVSDVHVYVHHLFVQQVRALADSLEPLSVRVGAVYWLQTGQH